MRACLYLTGLTFGRWIVLRHDRAANHVHYWRVRCECGEERSVSGSHLTRGFSKSCGCLSKEMRSELGQKAALKHGFRYTRLYSIWTGIKKRTQYPGHKHFDNYGGRVTARCPAGIYVCDEWLDPVAFIRWALMHGYADIDTQSWLWTDGAPVLAMSEVALTIDREDVDGPYHPDNCRWATRSEQERNKWREIHRRREQGDHQNGYKPVLATTF